MSMDEERAASLEQEALDLLSDIRGRRDELVDGPEREALDEIDSLTAIRWPEEYDPLMDARERCLWLNTELDYLRGRLEEARYEGDDE
jgi:hypothetical protein